jgi:hypothetical protein
LFDAVPPAASKTEALIVPHVDRCIMTHHLEEMSAEIVPGSYQWLK